MMCFSWGLFLLNNLLLKEKTNCGQALSVVSLTKLKPFAFIIINKFYILIHFMIICIIIKMHWKRLFQMQDLHGVFTVCTRRAHNAPTALKKFPQRSHSALSNYCANAKPRRLFWACSKQTPPHGVLGDCTARGFCWETKTARPQIVCQGGECCEQHDGFARARWHRLPVAVRPIEALKKTF